MNERVMQFRIGMFVIVAGLVLTMMVIWFGESPALLRDYVFVKVHFTEAPGVAEGTPVRKSGVRVGEVAGITFDERPNLPDGVIVTISLEHKYHIRAGSVPRVTRSLIGDVAIDLLPGTEPGQMATSKRPVDAPIVEGTVAPDPSKALAAATEAFERVGGTLNTIDEAFAGLAKITKHADRFGPFMETWEDTGKQLSGAAASLNRMVKANEADFQPTMKNLSEVAAKLNATFDPATQESLKKGLNQLSTVTDRLNTSLADAAPAFKDLGAPLTTRPKTDLGQSLRRLNMVTSDLGLLTASLRGPDGKLNPNGSLQMLILKSEAYDNLNRMATNANEVFSGFKPVINYFRIFAEKIAREPSALTRGALQR